MTKNEKLKAFAKEKKVLLWEIANRYGMTDSNFSRMLRQELSAEETDKIKKIIEFIALERSK